MRIPQTGYVPSLLRFLILNYSSARVGELRTNPQVPNRLRLRPPHCDHDRPAVGGPNNGLCDEPLERVLFNRLGSIVSVLCGLYMDG